MCDLLSVFCLLCRDTAGQERYQTITKQYYRRAQVIPSIWTVTGGKLPSWVTVALIIYISFFIFCGFLSRVSSSYMTSQASRPFSTWQSGPAMWMKYGNKHSHFTPLHLLPFTVTQCLYYLPSGLVWVTRWWSLISVLSVFFCCCFAVCPRHGAEDFSRKQVWWEAQEAGDKGPRKQGLIEPYFVFFSFIMFLGCPSVCPILVSAISQQRLEGISSDLPQTSTWIQGWTT